MPRHHQKDAAAQQQLVDAWNHPEGTEVILRKDDGSEVLTKTRSPPFLLGGHTACIQVDGIAGCYLLERVRPAPPQIGFPPGRSRGGRLMTGAAPKIVGLTLWRPWSWMISHGPKRIENRPWPPPAWLLGQYVAIHAGQHYEQPGAVRLLAAGYQVPGEEVCPQGIVAVALVLGVARTIEEAVRIADDPGQAEWFSGEFGWVLASVVRIEPVICAGARGLWRLQPHILAAVRRRWKEAAGA